jgi:hypothetical protein
LRRTAFHVLRLIAEGKASAYDTLLDGTTILDVGRQVVQGPHRLTTL